MSKVWLQHAGVRGSAASTVVVASRGTDLDNETRRVLGEHDVDVVAVSDLPSALVLACQRRQAVAVIEDALAGEQLVAAVSALAQGAGIPVLIAVSGPASTQVLAALDAGARGVVGLPVVGSELCRALADLIVGSRDECIVIGDAELRPHAAELWLGGRPMALGRQGLALARELLTAYPSAASRERIAAALGDGESPASAETLKRAVSRLRSQIMAAAADRRHTIEAVRGCGYRWVVQEA